MFPRANSLQAHKLQVILHLPLQPLQPQPLIASTVGLLP
jgi:polysaccharide deacetylase 2 family uncharacterized protein YibQ